MAIKDEKLIVKISSEDKQELNELAEKLDRPAAQIVREAVKEKVASLKGLTASTPQVETV